MAAGVAQRLACCKPADRNVIILMQRICLILHLLSRLNPMPDYKSGFRLWLNNHKPYSEIRALLHVYYHRMCVCICEWSVCVSAYRASVCFDYYAKVPLRAEQNAYCTSHFYEELSLGLALQVVLDINIVCMTWLLALRLDRIGSSCWSLPKAFCLTSIYSLVRITRCCILACCRDSRYIALRCVASHFALNWIALSLNWPGATMVPGPGLDIKPHSANCHSSAFYAAGVVQNWIVVVWRTSQKGSETPTAARLPRVSASCRNNVPASCPCKRRAARLETQALVLRHTNLQWCCVLVTCPLTRVYALWTWPDFFVVMPCWCALIRCVGHAFLVTCFVSVSYICGLGVKT